MAELRAYQPSFVTGEISPALGARVDLAKFQSALRSALNLFIYPHGGAANRAGLEFVGEVKDSTKETRLIPFQFSTDQSYQLEVGENYARIWRDGGVIVDGGDPYEIDMPFLAADLFNVVWVQEADVMYLTNNDYAITKLARHAETDWDVTEPTLGPSNDPPDDVFAAASYKYRSGDTDWYQFKVTAVSASGAESAASVASLSISFQHENDDGRYVKLVWNAVAGAVSYNVYRFSSGTGLVGTSYTNTMEFPSGEINGDGTAIPSVAAGGAPATPTGVVATIEFGQDYSYKVSAIDGETGEESLPSDVSTVRNDMAYAGNRNTITWTAVDGASAYIIYRADSGVYGYIGRSETTSFIDENITADISDTPQTARNPFVGEGNYPAIVGFVEQRLALAGTKNNPQAMYLSQSAYYENFGVSALAAKASDAVTFRIRARQVNDIRAIVARKGMLVMTSGAEWLVRGDSNGEPITPSSILIENEGYRGSARVQPIIVGDVVLFAQNGGGVIRDFTYQLANDGFQGRDITILARHLFENKSVKAWAYAQSPFSIVWVIMTDGSLRSLTYMPEHDVWAWTRHQTAASGVFEDVSVIREGIEDTPYFIVRRTINGQSKRYIERLHTRVMADVTDAFFVDCGLTYEGAPAKTITGLDHLYGCVVNALADGNVVRDLTVGPVTGGIGVVLPNAASKVHVGLPFESALQTLNLDLGQVKGIGTVQGRQKSVANVVLRVQDTRGIWVGHVDGSRDDDRMVEYKQRAGENWDAAIQLFTGDIEMTPMWDWNTSGSMWVKQFDPLPMTVLAIMPDVVIGG